MIKSADASDESCHKPLPRRWPTSWGDVVTAKDALAFVELHGIVLESARGPVPTLAEAVAGGRIQGSWWGHAKGREIFAATRAVRASSDVVICRLIDGKVTYVDRRLWPAMVCLANKLDKNMLTAIREEHTTAGSHRTIETPFPEWVPPTDGEVANRMTHEEALSALGDQAVSSLGLGGR
jgi:hypothetical protein